MNLKLENIILPKVEAFVAEVLNGRYKEFVCDKFLIGLLMRELSRPCSPMDACCRGQAIADGASNYAYEASCHIFENILECQCGAGGNGHHVAQSFERHMLA